MAEHAKAVTAMNAVLDLFPPDLLHARSDIWKIIWNWLRPLKTPPAIYITGTRQRAIPAHDHRVNVIKVTPDPGVIEVNTAPINNWSEMVENTTGLYEEAHLCRLGTEKFMVDGRHTGTGGGNHIVIGGDAGDSPLLRKPGFIAASLAIGTIIRRSPTCSAGYLSAPPARRRASMKLATIRFTNWNWRSSRFLITTMFSSGWWIASSAIS